MIRAVVFIMPGIIACHGLTPRQGWLLSRAGGIMAGTMLLEIALISMQSLRGATSHFNSTTPFDSGVFALMGVAVAGLLAAFMAWAPIQALFGKPLVY